MEEEYVLISRRGSSLSGVGSHNFVGEGCNRSRGGESYFHWTRGTF